MLDKVAVAVHGAYDEIQESGKILSELTEWIEDKIWCTKYYNEEFDIEKELTYLKGRLKDAKDNLDSI